MFKPGDKVQCINVSSGYNVEPVLGQAYKVTEILSNSLTGNEAWIMVEWDDISGVMSFKARDFVLAMPKETKTKARYRDWEFA